MFQVAFFVACFERCAFAGFAYLRALQEDKSSNNVPCTCIRWGNGRWHWPLTRGREIIAAHELPRYLRNLQGVGQVFDYPRTLDLGWLCPAPVSSVG